MLLFLYLRGESLYSFRRKTKARTLDVPGSGRVYTAKNVCEEESGSSLRLPKWEYRSFSWPLRGLSKHSTFLESVKDWSFVSTSVGIYSWCAKQKLFRNCDNQIKFDGVQVGKGVKNRKHRHHKRLKDKLNDNIKVKDYISSSSILPVESRLNPEKEYTRKTETSYLQLKTPTQEKTLKDGKKYCNHNGPVYISQLFDIHLTPDPKKLFPVVTSSETRRDSAIQDIQRQVNMMRSNFEGRKRYCKTRFASLDENDLRDKRFSDLEITDRSNKFRGRLTRSASLITPRYDTSGSSNSSRRSSLTTPIASNSATILRQRAIALKQMKQNETVNTQNRDRKSSSKPPQRRKLPNTKSVNRKQSQSNKVQQKKNPTSTIRRLPAAENIDKKNIKLKPMIKSKSEEKKRISKIDNALKENNRDSNANRTDDITSSVDEYQNITNLKNDTRSLLISELSRQSAMTQKMRKSTEGLDDSQPYTMKPSDILLNNNAWAEASTQDRTLSSDEAGEETAKEKILLSECAVEETKQENASFVEEDTEETKKNNTLSSEDTLEEMKQENVSLKAEALDEKKQEKMVSASDVGVDKMFSSDEAEEETIVPEVRNKASSMIQISERLYTESESMRAFTNNDDSGVGESGEYLDLLGVAENNGEDAETQEIGEKDEDVDEECSYGSVKLTVLRRTVTSEENGTVNIVSAESILTEYGEVNYDDRSIEKTDTSLVDDKETENGLDVVDNVYNIMSRVNGNNSVDCEEITNKETNNENSENNGIYEDVSSPIGETNGNSLNNEVNLHPDFVDFLDQFSDSNHIENNNIRAASTTNSSNTSIATTVISNPNVASNKKNNNLSININKCDDTFDTNTNRISKENTNIKLMKETSISDNETEELETFKMSQDSLVSPGSPAKSNSEPLLNIADNYNFNEQTNITHSKPQDEFKNNQSSAFKRPKDKQPTYVSISVSEADLTTSMPKRNGLTTSTISNGTTPRVSSTASRPVTLGGSYISSNIKTSAKTSARSPARSDAASDSSNSSLASGGKPDMGLLAPNTPLPPGVPWSRDTWTSRKRYEMAHSDHDHFLSSMAVSPKEGRRLSEKSSSLPRFVKKGNLLFHQDQTGSHADGSCKGDHYHHVHHQQHNQKYSSPVCCSRGHDHHHGNGEAYLTPRQRLEKETKLLKKEVARLIRENEQKQAEVFALQCQVDGQNEKVEERNKQNDEKYIQIVHLAQKIGQDEKERFAERESLLQTQEELAELKQKYAELQENQERLLHEKELNIQVKQEEQLCQAAHVGVSEATPSCIGDKHGDAAEKSTNNEEFHQSADKEELYRTQQELAELKEKYAILQDKEVAMSTYQGELYKTQQELVDLQEKYAEFRNTLRHEGQGGYTSAHSTDSDNEDQTTETELADLKIKYAALQNEMTDQKAKFDDYLLGMYKKGQEAARFEREQELDFLLADTNSSTKVGVSITELSEKLYRTEGELARWQALRMAETYSAPVNGTNTSPPTPLLKSRHNHHSLLEPTAASEADVTLAFVRDAFFHFFTDRLDTEQHLRALLKIFAYPKDHLDHIRAGLKVFKNIKIKRVFPDAKK